MASRVITQCLRHIAKRPSVFTTTPKYIRSLPLLKVEGIYSPFAHSFSKSVDESVAETDAGLDPNAVPVIDAKEASKMRTRVIPVEVSMKYLKSKGYATTYGTEPIWVQYRRNFKGQFAQATRKTCIRQGRLSTGNPCPICRDEYLILDHRNVELLKQFISPFNGSILPTKKTGLCHAKQRELLVAIAKAKDYGLISFDVPIREYDYSDFQAK